MLGELRVRVIWGPPRPTEGLDAEKGFKTQRGKREVTPEKAAIERVQADRAIPLAAQMPDERGNGRARKGVVRVEAVIAELAFRDPGQHRKLGPHRIGTPAGDLEPAEGPAICAASVEP